MVRLAVLLRLAVPVLLTLARAAVILRVLLLLMLALAASRFLILAVRLAGNQYRKARRRTSDGKKIVDGSYRIVDDEEPHT